MPTTPAVTSSTEASASSTLSSSSSWRLRPAQAAVSQASGHKLGASGHTYVATLTLDGVRKSQSGNYSCSPSNTGTASVRLHVIDGENT